MLPSDGTPDRRAKVRAAAHAAASWARARRAAWTDAPLILPPPAPLTESPPVGLVPVELPESSASVALHDTPPSLRARASGTAHSAARLISRHLPRVAAVLLIGVAGAAAIVGAAYVWTSLPSVQLRALLPQSGARDAVPPPQPAPAPRASVPGVEREIVGPGRIRIESTPTGARVFLDGKPRGETPLTIANVPAGAHVIELESAEGRVRRPVTVAAGETATLNELVFAGWLAVYAPFDLRITEGGQSLRLDDRSQVMLPAGPHDIHVANEALGYDAVHHVELKPGAVTTLSVTPPRSTLTVTASEPAEVWLDGNRVGETPLTALSVDLGTHEVVLRRAGAADRRLTVTVKVQPLTLDVDFSKPGV